MAFDIPSLTDSLRLARLRNVAFQAFMVLTLISCQIGTKIEVRNINDTTVFVVLREDGQSASVQSINVSEGRGELGSQANGA